MMRKLCSLVVILLVSLHLALAADAAETAARLLPDKAGAFSVTGRTQTATNLPAPESFRVTSGGAKTYRGSGNAQVTAAIWETASETAAYSLWLNRLAELKGQPSEGVGTSAFTFPNGLGFWRGRACVVLSGTAKPNVLMDLAQQLAKSLDAGEGEIPALVKHLPDGANSFAPLIYAVTPAALSAATDNPPVLAAVSFEGAEAASAVYNAGRLVLVEFHTPQLATANDAAIQAKIKELQASGQPVPTLYKRIGNYGAFVFNAPDAATAQSLLDQIKYEQMVQWLGENPYPLIRAQKRYVAMTSDIFLSVIKASGLAILLALGTGGLIGAAIFKRRRAQQLAATQYTDAGGMMRLNLDDLATPQTDATRLLEK